MPHLIDQPSWISTSDAFIQGLAAVRPKLSCRDQEPDSLSSCRLQFQKTRHNSNCRNAVNVSVTLGFALVIWVAILVTQPAFAQTTVRYPRPESDVDTRPVYMVKLLEKALQRSGQLYRLQPSKAHMPQSRALLELKEGKSIDIVWTVTSKQREADLLPIRIDVYKGLMGWRLLLIRKEAIKKFRDISVENLKLMMAGQGHDWPDLEILRANGFKVYGSRGYESLFKMLEIGRIDYFPRSIVEIWSEAESYRDMGIIVEPSIVIRYPTALYYFVSKRNNKLAIDLVNGLEQMIADGTFDRLFNEYHAELLERANLKKRKIFDINRDPHE